MIAIKIISNISLNKANIQYLASSELGMIKVFSEIISKEKGETRSKILGIIQTLSRNKKIQQYLSSKELGLVLVLVQILNMWENEVMDIVLRILLSLSGDESNNEYMVSSSVGFLTALKKISISHDNIDTCQKAWDTAMRLLSDIESRVPFLSDVIVEDEKGESRLKALDEIQGLVKEKEYHEAMLQSSLGLVKALSFAIGLKAADARSRALIIMRALSKKAKTNIGGDSDLKALLKSIVKGNNEINSKTAFIILNNVQMTKDDTVVILLLQLSYANGKDELTNILKDLNQLSGDDAKIDISDVDILLGKFRADLDEENDLLLLSILSDISKSKDMVFLQKLMVKLSELSSDRLNMLQNKFIISTVNKISELVGEKKEPEVVNTSTTTINEVATPPPLSVPIVEVKAGPTSSSFIQPVPPGSTAAHHSLMSPISNGRSLSISVPSMPLSNREEALQNEVLALHNELLTLRATIKALENSSHAWRILNDSSKIKGNKQDLMKLFMDEMGLQEACDLTTCSKNHVEELAEYLKPVAASRFINLLFP